MNNINIVGRIVKDADLKIYETNNIITFTVAVDRDYVKKDGSRDTDFINCEYSRKDLSKLAQYVKKGVLVSVEGALNLDKYIKDDETKYYTKVRVRNIKLLSKAGENKEDDSDLPF